MVLPPKVLVEADLFFSYLAGDNLSSHSERVVLAAVRGKIELYACCEVYDGWCRRSEVEGRLSMTRYCS